ncbi:hypothetical protein F2Q70_00011466 [Brassica cretica]|uniref:Retrotransposon gag domain-containing protein n=1 Tax=Brassica cretica TaxID=69181 RepID=A0A8S9MB09_BRACR|nr:hypothetical protein F2Q70_00011466 [Brassica cretica]
MNPELLAFLSSFVGGRPRPRRLFTDPFPSLVPSWGIFQRLIAILLSVGMRGPTEFERAQDGGASEVSSFFGLCPSQLTPLTWRTLMAIQVLEELHGFSVGIHEILYSYYYAPLVNKAGFYHLRSRDGTLLVEEPSRGIRGNYPFRDGWSNRYVFVKIQEPVGHPTSWRTVSRRVSSGFLCWRSGSEAYNGSSSAILMGNFPGNVVKLLISAIYDEHQKVKTQKRRPLYTPPPRLARAASLEKDAQTYDVEDSESEPEPDKEAPDGATKEESPMVAYLEQMFTKRLDAMQSMVERLPRVAPPIRKSSPDSYADTPFMDEVTLIEMPRKFSFPSIKAYDGTTDLDDHVAQYKQRMLAVVLPKGSRKATLCKRFGSTLTRPALQWYINLPSRSIASFAVLSDKFVEQFACSRDLEKTTDSLYEILQHRVEPLRGYLARFNQEKVAIPECSNPTAISAFKRGLLPDRDLYKELTKYQCKTMEDVLSRAWA